MQATVRILAFLLMCIFPLGITADVIEECTDCYIIHVDEMEVDPEESLMDILMMCPEFLSEDGVTLASDDYIICIDDLEMAVGNEAFLHNTKACEVSIVKISKSDVVGNGLDGLEKEISITFRNSAARSKEALWGSTYGNAQVYSDLTHHGRNFTLTAMVDGSARYRKYDYNPARTQREFVNDVRLAGKWHLSDRDSMQIVLAQAFTDEKYRPGEPMEPMQTYIRDVFFIGTYSHQFNERGSSINVECGGQYSNDSQDEDVAKGTIVYALVESELSIIDDKLELMIGTEHKYDNTWEPEIQRQQYMHNDLYVMLYCNLGRWQFSLGDRFRNMNFWHNAIDDEENIWHASRRKHGLMGSVGCNLGKGHYVQGTISQRYYTPSVSDFVDDSEYYSGRKFRYKGYMLPASYVAELRYTYQRRGLLLMASASNINFDYAPEAPNSMQSIKTTATLRRGIVSMTLGASYHHSHWDSMHDNYYNLKFKPALSLTARTRLSATLLYLSKRFKSDIRPNTYLDVKLNHYITPRINLFANYHDIAGQKTGNRALILGATFYIN